MSTNSGKEEKKAEEKEQEDKKEEEQKVDDPDAMQPQQKLFYFAKIGDVDGIKAIANNTEINEVDLIGFKSCPYKTKNTALHYAVESGSLECVKVLYNLQAKLDVTNKLQSTPLHIAASLGHTEIVQFLIEMKAEIEAKNIVSNTALHCAVYAGHTATVEVILSHLDEPRDALLEPNGIGIGAAKYTAHEDMKSLLRPYFPKRNNKKEENENNENNENNKDIEEEPPKYDNNPSDEMNDDENNTENYKD